VRRRAGWETQRVGGVLQKREEVKRMKKFLLFLLVVVFVMAMTMFTFAAETGSSDVTAAVSTALTTMQSDAMSMILLAVPIGLGFTALFFGIRKVISMLKATSK
jgi:magnesium-transporting ATPase (P-type)